MRGWEEGGPLLTAMTTCKGGAEAVDRSDRVIGQVLV